MDYENMKGLLYKTYQELNLELTNISEKLKNNQLNIQDYSINVKFIRQTKEQMQAVISDYQMKYSTLINKYFYMFSGSGIQYKYHHFFTLEDEKKVNVLEQKLFQRITKISNELNQYQQILLKKINQKNKKARGSIPPWFASQANAEEALSPEIIEKLKYLNEKDKSPKK